MEKRLYKSSTNKILAGVCGGIGEYFDIDPVLVRVVWVISAFFGGAGILAYIIAAIVIPSREETYGKRVYEASYRPASSSTSRPQARPAQGASSQPAAGSAEGTEGTLGAEGTAGVEGASEGQQTAEDGTAAQSETEGVYTGEGQEERYVRKSGDSNSRLLAGTILIVLGGIFLMRELMPWIDGGLIVAACFIALGIYFLVRKNGEQQ